MRKYKISRHESLWKSGAHFYAIRCMHYAHYSVFTLVDKIIPFEKKPDGVLYYMLILFYEELMSGITPMSLK